MFTLLSNKHPIIDYASFLKISSFSNCIILPSYWLYDARKDFPDLWTKKTCFWYKDNKVHSVQTEVVRTTLLVPRSPYFGRYRRIKDSVEKPYSYKNDIFKGDIYRFNKTATTYDFDEVTRMTFDRNNVEVIDLENYEMKEHEKAQNDKSEELDTKSGREEEDWERLGARPKSKCSSNNYKKQKSERMIVSKETIFT